jgi:hypothetical protein
MSDVIFWKEIWKFQEQITVNPSELHSVVNITDLVHCMLKTYVQYVRGWMHCNLLEQYIAI